MWPAATGLASRHCLAGLPNRATFNKSASLAYTKRICVLSGCQLPTPNCQLINHCQLPTPNCQLIKMGFPAGRSGAALSVHTPAGLRRVGRYPRQSLTRVCGYMGCGLPERGALVPHLCGLTLHTSARRGDLNAGHKRGRLQQR